MKSLTDYLQKYHLHEIKNAFFETLKYVEDEEMALGFKALSFIVTLRINFSSLCHEQPGICQSILFGNDFMFMGLFKAQVRELLQSLYDKQQAMDPTDEIQSEQVHVIIEFGEWPFKLPSFQEGLKSSLVWQENRNSIKVLEGQVILIFPVIRRIVRQTYFCQNQSCRNQQLQHSEWISWEYDKMGNPKRQLGRNEQSSSFAFESTTTLTRKDLRCLSCRSILLESLPHRIFHVHQAIKVSCGDCLSASSIIVILSDSMVNKCCLGDKVRIIGVFDRHLTSQSNYDLGYYISDKGVIYDNGLHILARSIEILVVLAKPLTDLKLVTPLSWHELASKFYLDHFNGLGDSLASKDQVALSMTLLASLVSGTGFQGENTRPIHVHMTCDDEYGIWTYIEELASLYLPSKRFTNGRDLHQQSHLFSIKGNKQGILLPDDGKLYCLEASLVDLARHGILLVETGLLSKKDFNQLQEIFFAMKGAPRTLNDSLMEHQQQAASSLPCDPVRLWSLASVSGNGNRQMKGLLERYKSNFDIILDLRLSNNDKAYLNHKLCFLLQSQENDSKERGNETQSFWQRYLETASYLEIQFDQESRYFIDQYYRLYRKLYPERCRKETDSAFILRSLLWIAECLAKCTLSPIVTEDHAIFAIKLAEISLCASSGILSKIEANANNNNEIFCEGQSIDSAFSYSTIRNLHLPQSETFENACVVSEDDPCDPFDLKGFKNSLTFLAQQYL